MAESRCAAGSCSNLPAHARDTIGVSRERQLPASSGLLSVLQAQRLLGDSPSSRFKWFYPILTPPDLPVSLTKVLESEGIDYLYFSMGT